MHSYFLHYGVNVWEEMVLILVLMEDALVPDTTDDIESRQVCLNPCFNGRCTRTLNLSDGKRHFLQS